MLGVQRERRGAIARLAGHLDPVLHLEQHPEPAPDHRVVVDDQHGDGPRHRPPPAPAAPAVTGTTVTGTVIRTRVPVSPDWTVSVPPAADARSRIEASPSPPDGAS